MMHVQYHVVTAIASAIKTFYVRIMGHNEAINPPIKLWPHYDP